MSIQCTEAEWKILELLWDREPRTMPEITRALEGQTGWTRQTVISLLRRMQAKGTVACDDSGPLRLYTARVRAQEARRDQTRRLVDRVFGGRASLLVSSLVEGGELTEKEREEILRILRQGSSGKEK